MGVDLKTSRVMLLLSLLGALGHASGAAIEPCCLSKTVGGVDYVLWDENTGMTSGYGCLQDCIYVRLDDPDKQYCFASGTLPVEYNESPSPSSMPPSPSMYPPSPSEYPSSPSMYPPSPSEFPPSPSAMPPAPSSSMPAAPTQAPSPVPAGPTGAVPSNDDYCAKNTDHTMCKYSGPSAECADKTEVRELSAAAKQAILDLHNDLRKKVAKGEETNGINPPQPGATNMRKMGWKLSTRGSGCSPGWYDQGCSGLV